MKILASLRVTPVGTSSTSVSSYVAEAVKILERRNVKYIVTPFSTDVELGSLPELAEVVEEVVSRLRSLGVSRVLVDVTVDFRFDKEVSLERRVSSVSEKLGKN
ncbi:MAG: MTH1187 family thiamine-binding protein [Sulfolobales archaeon]|nr:MTH1187 family thiamine-binding protein [Sulfolobales archaeon]MDW8011086.1 MTH1187 family thiamine-binding protein [Sulfolobales archaeon]